jgi:hypothetical protein
MGMRDYTYLDAGRFSIVNIYRTKRFDVDRLDLNWPSGPEHRDFVRGFRMVDHEDGNRIFIHGTDADDLIFSMAYIMHQDDSKEAYFEEYIMQCMASKQFLVTEQKKTSSSPVEEILH